MARETAFFVQCFFAKGDRLKAEPVSRWKSEEAARRAAERQSESKAGAVAFCVSADAELGDYDEEPTVLLVIGSVPEEFQR
ncbi:MAG: hypothetical protein ABW199_01810 [Caulobacterales bacterium]